MKMQQNSTNNSGTDFFRDYRHRSRGRAEKINEERTEQRKAESCVHLVVTFFLPFIRVILCFSVTDFC
jgi:hypothetical protein